MVVTCFECWEDKHKFVSLLCFYVRVKESSQIFR